MSQYVQIIDVSQTRRRRRFPYMVIVLQHQRVSRCTTTWGSQVRKSQSEIFFYSIEILLILFKLVSKNKNIKITEIKQQNRTRVKG